MLERGQEPGRKGLGGPISRLVLVFVEARVSALQLSRASRS